MNNQHYAPHATTKIPVSPQGWEVRKIMSNRAFSYGFYCSFISIWVVIITRPNVATISYERKSADDYRVLAIDVGKNNFLRHYIQRMVAPLCMFVIMWGGQRWQTSKDMMRVLLSSCSLQLTQIWEWWHQTDFCLQVTGEAQAKLMAPMFLRRWSCFLLLGHVVQQIIIIWWIYLVRAAIQNLPGSAGLGTRVNSQSTIFPPVWWSLSQTRCPILLPS